MNPCKADFQVNYQAEETVQELETKAEEYAAQSGRFTLLSVEAEVELRTERGNHLLLYNNGEWSCDCASCGAWGNCHHTVAAKLHLKSLPL